MLQMTKGSKLKMQKADGSSIQHVRLELGWKPQAFSTGHKFDVDVSAIALVDNNDPAYPFGKGLSEDFVLFYNSNHRTRDDTTAFIDAGASKAGKPTVPGCAMVHSGDSRDGTADLEPNGADEIINIYFERLPAEVNVIHIPVTIDDAAARNQNFGQISGSYVAIFNHDTNECLARYDLEDDAADATALLFVELRKKDDVWAVKAVNQGFKKGLGEFFNLYGFQTE